MKVFVTGSAGFIGFHTAKRFLEGGHEVVGFDAHTDYYDPQLKRDREAVLQGYDSFRAVEGRLEDAELLRSTVLDFAPDLVIHLAAQAGVRYSIENPGAYIDSNIQGTFNLLEVLREHKPQHLMMASTSSAYGANKSFPFKETDRTGFPVSLYAATKIAAEAISHSYASLFDIPTTCFRFFTVYGPWGRPDMAPYKFVDRIYRGEQIEVYGNGHMSRDLTYIDDLIEGIERLSAKVPTAGTAETEVSEQDSLSPVAPWRVVNIGGGNTVQLMRFIGSIEEAMGVEAKKKMLPMQPGDVTDTLASPALLTELTGFTPNTPIELGVKSLVDWYTEYKSVVS